MILDWFIRFITIRKLLTRKCFTKKILAKQIWLYLWNWLPQMPTISDEKVACKNIIQICTNCGTLSMQDILFSIFAWILINASLFLYDSFNPYSTTIFKVLFHFFFHSCIIPGDQLKLNFRKRIQERKFSSTTKIRFKQLSSIDQNKFCW